jgi:hypothetical protein
MLLVLVLVLLVLLVLVELVLLVLLRGRLGGPGVAHEHHEGLLQLHRARVADLQRVLVLGPAREATQA